MSGAEAIAASVIGGQQLAQAQQALVQDAA
jgi:hypothetical protein